MAWDRLPTRAPGSVYTTRAWSPPPHRLRPQAEGCGYDPDNRVGHHGGAYSEAAVDIRGGVDGSTADGKNCARFGSSAPVTCRSAPGRCFKPVDLKRLQMPLRTRRRSIGCRPSPPGRHVGAGSRSWSISHCASLTSVG
jgi:hypothetical protein